MTNPLHHVDTSVIVESEKTLDGRFCARYFQKLDYNYDGKFSLPVLGELMIRLFFVKSSEKRHAFLDLLIDLKATRNIGIYTPADIRDIVSKIKEIDTRLSPTDIDIIACAIEDGANNLVTLDKDLIGNKAVEREFGLRIVHPKDLL